MYTLFIKKNYAFFPLIKITNFCSANLRSKMKRLKISDKTLAKALDKNKPYNGHYYKSLGSKTLC